jgi:hypothetical protein
VYTFKQRSILPEMNASFYKCVELNKFKYKEIQQWEQIYKKYNAHLCPLMARESIGKIKTTGSKYVACVEGNGQHVCGVLPIMIGTQLDRSIQSEEDPAYEKIVNNFSGTLLNFGCFWYFPKYLLNNNKQIHKYINTQQPTISRLFLYNEQQFGHMLYKSLSYESSPLMLRLPSMEEYIVHPTHLQHINSDSTLPFEYLLNLIQCWLGGTIDDFDLDEFTKLFAIKSVINSIDDINNKSVYNAPILLDQLLGLLLTTDDVKKMKAIKQAITSGNLFFLTCKKECNNNTNKNQKDVSRFISKHGTKSMYVEKQMYCNLDETSIDCCLNQIKRSNSKNSKFIPYALPENATMVISPFFCANMSNASRNLLLSYHTRITFIETNDTYKVYQFICAESCRDCPKDFVLVLNSIPFKGIHVCRNHAIEFLLKMKMTFVYVLFTLHDKYIFIIWQSGNLVFPMQIVYPATDSICACNNYIMAADPQVPMPNLEPILSRIPEQYKRDWCGHHIFVTKNDLIIIETILNQNYTFRYFQTMDHNALEIGKYMEHTPISKIITAVKTVRNAYTTELSDLTNKELTKGYCPNKFVSLFTVFYDFKGKTVGDSYVLNKNLALGIKFFVKNSAIFTASTKQFYFDRNLQIIPGTRGYIQIGKIYSRTKITFKRKRICVMYLGHDTHLGHRYLLWMPIYSNIISKIDTSTLRIKFQTIKKKVTISVLYSTKEECKSNIKLSNSFGQKGLGVFDDLSSLTTQSGRQVDVVAHPKTILCRQAFGQIKNQTKCERVYHNKKYIGMGGYCEYIYVNTFPHDEIHGGQLGTPMKLDKLTYNAAIGNNISLLDHTSTITPQLPANVNKLLELTKMYGKSVEMKAHKHIIC